MWLIEDLIAYLSEALDVPVSTSMPVDIKNTDSAKVKNDQVTVVWDGGSGTRFLERPRITFHAWSTTDIKAAQLCERVVRALDEAPDHLANVGTATQNSRYTNVYVDGTPRWTCVYVFVVNK